MHLLVAVLIYRHTKHGKKSVHNYIIVYFDINNFKMINDTVEGIVNVHIGDDQEPAEWDMESLNAMLTPIFPFAPVILNDEQMKTYKKNNLIQFLMNHGHTTLQGFLGIFEINGSIF